MWGKEKLNSLLTEPSERLIEDIKKIEGDIMILGAGGKMGPTVCLLAQNAVQKAGIQKKIYAVSRFSDPEKRNELESAGVIVLSADLQNPKDLGNLPIVKNIIFMAGRKFGTDGNEWQTWGMNAVVPAMVCEHFKGSTFVAFSSGNIYPLVFANSGGAIESLRADPIGEYPQSCLARERIFEYFSNKHGSKVLIFRLSYAIALEYGVISDIAQKVAKGQAIDLSNGCFNCIWQGDANEFAIRSLLLADSPVEILNVTGPEIAGVRDTALKLGKLLGKEPTFIGESNHDAYLLNPGKAIARFGYPQVSLDTMIEWQAQWILEGGHNLNMPTHFEERKGSY
ncbi:MAG TPA: NAD-dependent epimerase/dehydratase family protein [Sphaerochaeta sp.]|nr:NAD-dependent epimerase/dehydratase family protein [Sphaerochaeta sp.]